MKAKLMALADNACTYIHGQRWVKPSLLPPPRTRTIRRVQRSYCACLWRRESLGTRLGFFLDVAQFFGKSSTNKHIVKLNIHDATLLYSICWMQLVARNRNGVYSRNLLHATGNHATKEHAWSNFVACNKLHTTTLLRICQA